MIDIGNRICAVAVAAASATSVPLRPQLPRRSTETGACWPRPPRAIVEASSSPSQEGIVSKRLTSVYRSGPSRTWIKVKNLKAPAATRAIDGTF
jgi:hypothetical protein